MVQSLVRTWNRRDAVRFAELFSPSAEYTTGSGARVVGRLGIGSLVQADAAGVQIELVGTADVMLAGVTGVVRFGWRSTEQGKVARHGAITCTIVRSGQGWLIERLTNDEARDVRGSRTRG